MISTQSTKPGARARMRVCVCVCVVSACTCEREKERERATWCFTPSQPLRLYQGEESVYVCVEVGGGGGGAERTNVLLTRVMEYVQYFIFTSSPRRETKRERESETGGACGGGRKGVCGGVGGVGLEDIDYQYHALTDSPHNNIPSDNFGQSV